MKPPTESDFIIQKTEAAVEATFEPTKISYTFYRLADTGDIAKHGPILTEPDVVRHAGSTGDTGDYSSHEVQQMAHRLALQALR